VLIAIAAGQWAGLGPRLLRGGLPTLLRRTRAGRRVFGLRKFVLGSQRLHLDFGKMRLLLRGFPSNLLAHCIKDMLVKVVPVLALVVRSTATAQCRN
jgi:hypothetical protein